MSSFGVFQVHVLKGRQHGKTFAVQQQAAAYNFAALHKAIQVTGPRGVSASAFIATMQSEMDAIRAELSNELARHFYGEWADRWELNVQQCVNAILEDA